MSLSSPNSTSSPERQAEDAATGGSAVGFACLAWLVPGAAHLLLGQSRRGTVFLVVLTLMFVLGCAFDGRLFPFQTSEWLVFLAALAQWGLGLPRLIGGVAGFGEGHVTSITYEYGNTFLMAAGLLNTLVALNAYDLARSRRRR